MFDAIMRMLATHHQYYCAKPPRMSFVHVTQWPQL